MTKKEIELNGTNLSLVGRGKDANGNQTVKLKFPNKKAFSIQTNGNLPKTKNIISGTHRISSISQDDLETIKDEVVDYITKHGSMLQKRMLKAYFKSGGGVGKRSTHSINQDRRRLSKEPHEQAYLPKRKGNYYADGGEISKESQEAIAKLEKLVNSDNPMITDEVKEKAKKKIAELSKVEAKAEKAEMETTPKPTPKQPVAKKEVAPEDIRHKLKEGYSYSWTSAEIGEPNKIELFGFTIYDENGKDVFKSSMIYDDLKQVKLAVNNRLSKIIPTPSKPTTKKEDEEIIKDKIKEIKDIYGIVLTADDYFTGIRKHNGKEYFNVIIEGRVSESNVLNRLKKAVSQNVISSAEPGGVNRISIFLHRKTFDKKPTPKKEVKAPKDSWKDKLAMLKGKKGYKGKIANEKKPVSGTKSRNIKRDLEKQALPKGKRISKDGNVYYESRANRSDIDPKQKFKTGGKVEKIVTLEDGKKYKEVVINNVNSSGINEPIVEYHPIDKFEKGGEVKSSGWGINLNW